MASLAESLISSASRPLVLRRRRDLKVQRQRYQGRVYYVVTDPVSLQYLRFEPEEYALLELVDGQRSLDQIKHAFEKRFAPQTITHEEIYHFISRLHQSGLVLSQMSGQGPQLYKRHHRKRWQQNRAMFSNPLAIRFRGINPDPLLKVLYPWCAWVYSKLFLTFAAVLMLSALALVLVHFDTFLAKLPHQEDFFTFENLMWLWVVLGVTKIVHELGHGLTCRHFGGQCHELGVMLLVLTPCFYCNVSDSWRLPSKWKRIAIGAGGMAVEIFLASVATILWWFSHPGLVQQLCFNIMVVCSITTLLFNGNPLLRYDGYYIISDLLEIPNLQQKSHQIFSRQLAWWCFGIEKTPDPFLPQRHQWLFVTYAICSFCYRWVVVFSILFFLNQFLEPYGLKVVGQTLVALSLLSMVGMPLWKLIKYLRTPGRVASMKRSHLLVTTAAVTLFLAAVCGIPFAHYSETSFLVQPQDAQQVFVQAPGRLAEVLIEPGQQVTAGQPLARLESPELTQAITELTSQVERQRVYLQTLHDQRGRNPRAADQIPLAQEALSTLQEQLAERSQDLERLTLRAPIDGYLIAPPRVTHRQQPDERLPPWDGIPWDEPNRGCYLQTGDLFCLVGQPDQLEAALVIDQAEIEFVQVGQNVSLQLDQSSGDILPGTIVDIAQQDLPIAPRQLSGKSGGRLPTRTDASGQEIPLSTSYYALVPLDNAEGLLRPDLRGRARIAVGERTWGAWLWRTLHQTFHFQL